MLYQCLFTIFLRSDFNLFIKKSSICRKQFFQKKIRLCLTSQLYTKLCFNFFSAIQRLCYLEISFGINIFTICNNRLVLQLSLSGPFKRAVFENSYDVTFDYNNYGKTTYFYYNFLYQENIIQKEGQLYWSLLVSGLISGAAGSISAFFHEFAMTNYNSRFNLQEKYIIIGVDQFYSHFIHFQTSDYNKLVFFQLLRKHSENCLRPKCPSSSLKFGKINVNDKKQLEKLTIDIVSCIFKTSHGRSVVKSGMIHKPKFEQLQLQYISFLSQTAQRPLIGYVELRRYQQNQNNDNSLYFRELTSKISSELEFQIVLIINNFEFRTNLYSENYY